MKVLKYTLDNGVKYAIIEADNMKLRDLKLIFKVFRDLEEQRNCYIYIVDHTDDMRVYCEFTKENDE